MIRSIQVKIAIVAGASLLVTLLAVIGFSGRSVHETAVDSATAQVQALVRMQARGVSGEMASAMEAARTLAYTFSGIKDYENTLDIGREEATNMLANLLGSGGSVVGVYTLWEPDAFDGMDLGFADTQGHDDTGRFAPYWYRTGEDEILISALMASDAHAPEGEPAAWYTGARESRLPQVGEPVWVSHQGTDRLVTSLSVPIVANDNFYGVVGVDLDLAYAQALTGNADLFESFDGQGDAMVFSHDGTIIAHRSRPELRGNAISEAHEDWQEDLAVIQAGVEEAEKDEGTLAYFSPIRLAGIDTPWSVNILVPESVVSRAAMALTWKLVSLGAVFMFASLGIIWFLAGRIAKPLRKIRWIARNIADGDLEQSVDIYDATEVGQLADSFRHMQESFKAKAAAAREIAAGNLGAEIEISSEKDVLGKAMQTVKETLDAMDSDLQDTIEAMKCGRLDERCEPEQHQGSYRALLAGVNEALDAVIKPLRMTADYVDSLGRGCMPPQIDETYAGEYDRIKDNLNSCVTAVHDMSVDVDELTQACVNGELDSRANAERHQGDYRKIVQGFNEALDAVVTPLKRNADVMAQIADGQLPEPMSETYRGDFEAIKRSLNECIVAINRLAEDSQELMESAALGHLEKRADAERHKGDFRTIIAGFNETLDAVIHPFNEAAFILERVSERELTVRMDGEYMGDFSKFKEMLNTAVENLDQSMLQVEMASDQVETASVQIDTATQSLAQGASTQAASLQEISHNLKELTSSSQQNTANAQEAQNIAKSAVNSTQTGVSSMERLSQAIDRIKASSDETAKIVKTIDEIAFQTNLLALNAAVEAARAGEAGKGFAVVAEEVRNLAIRSAEAAKNTSAMIEEAERNAEDGVKINKEVLENLGEIDDQISRVGEMMSEIAVSSESQSEDVAMITGAIDQFSSITQENAASSEESASAAQELAAQAAEMRKMVAEFEISQRGSAKAMEESSAPSFDIEAGPAETCEPAMEFESPAPQFAPASSSSDGGDPRVAIPLDDDDMKLLSDF